MGVADTLGKLFGNSKFFAKLIPKTIIFVLFMNLFIIVTFFLKKEFYTPNESILWIVNLSLVLLFMMRNGAAEVYYMVKVKE